MEKYYIYENHRGGYFWSREELEENPDDWTGLRCETCGDYDWEIGVLELDHEPSEAEMKELAKKGNF